MKKQQAIVKRIERTYTLEEKEKGIATVFLLNSYTSASKKTGIPATTLHHWMDARDEGELVAIRKAIRTAVVQKAWSVAFKGLLQLAEAQEQYKIQDKHLTPEGLSKLAEMSERMTRILKNIGDVAQKLEIGGQLELLHGDKRPSELTLADLMQIGQDESMRELRRN